jgi:hypothetical protein
MVRQRDDYTIGSTVRSEYAVAVRKRHTLGFTRVLTSWQDHSI